MQKINKLGQAMRSPRYFPLLVLLVILTLSSLVVFWVQTSSQVTIQNASVTLRQSPDTNAKSISSIAKDQVVHVIKKEDNWLNVRYRQREGWLPQWLLDQPSLSSDQGLTAQVKKTTPFYQKASTSSAKIRDLTEGYQYDVVSESKGWTELIVNNQPGYVATADLNLSTKEQIQAQQETIRPEDIDITNAQYIQVRSEGQAFHSEPNLESTPYYNPSFNQRFKYLGTVNGDDGTEFYHVEDQNGQRGYVESRIVAFEDASKDHVDGPIAHSLNGAVILIDAGHGGSDPGAISQDPYAQEKAVTLAASNVLKAKLEAQGAVVMMTRTSDTDVSLEERAQLANQEKVDAFISIHFDEASSDIASGITTYYYHTQDESLANLVNTELAKIQLNNQAVGNNGAHFGNYYVLRENHQPSLLLELGYMSNKDDLKLIQNSGYYDAVAEAIVKGLEQYLESSSIAQ